ncbi:MAG: metal-dependent hydrolase [Owenweeksia sp.]|nr:metal-dependent hydrolase [Owenweeksia sp.]
MDSLSQIVLGAGVAEVILGRKAGNRAPLWGAIAGTIPDLDVIPAQWMNTVEALAFHRGISHSLLFSVVLAPLLGWLVYRLYRKRFGRLREWTLLFFMVLFTHALLDCFTTWGVQLFLAAGIPHRLEKYFCCGSILYPAFSGVPGLADD